MRKLSLKLRNAMTLTNTKEVEDGRSKTSFQRKLTLDDTTTTTAIPGSPMILSKKARSNTLSPEAMEALSRKPSSSFFKRGRSLTRGSSSASLPLGEFYSNEDDVFLSDALETLQEVLADRDRRRELISALIQHRGNYSVKIRFCSAVDEFTSTVVKAERLEKARCITRLFVGERALFQLDTISPEQAAKLAQGRFELLETVKGQILEELARDDIVMEACRNTPPSHAGRQE